MERLLKGRELVQQVFNPKQNEKVLLVCDEKNSSFAQLLGKVFNDFNVQVITWKIPESLRPLIEVPQTLTNLLLESDLTIYLFERKISEKQFRTQLAKLARKGGRVCIMTGFDENLMDALFVDYRKMSELNFKLKGILKQAKKIKITNALGTNIEFSIDNSRKIYLDHGKITDKIVYGSLPAGQVRLCPIEESFTGKIVTKLFEEIYFEKPLELIFKNGLLEIPSKIPEQAKSLFSLIKDASKKPDDNANMICEFGLGTNEKGIYNTKNILNAMKCLGNCTFAVGDAIGLGKAKSSIHAYCIIEKPTVLVDGKELLKEGKFLLENFSNVEPAK